MRTVEKLVDRNIDAVQFSHIHFSKQAIGSTYTYEFYNSAFFAIVSWWFCAVVHNPVLGSIILTILMPYAKERDPRQPNRGSG